MFTTNDFRPCDRVELHPATDLWMMGARVGTVIKIGRNKLTVHVDRLGREIQINPASIYAILA